MPLKLLLDENLRDRRLWSTIANLSDPDCGSLDIIRVGDAGGPPLGISDNDLIAWAAEHNRVLIGLDKATLPAHLQAFCIKGAYSPGIILLRGNLPINETVELLELVSNVSTEQEWANTCRWIPSSATLS